MNRNIIEVLQDLSHTTMVDVTKQFYIILFQDYPQLSTYFNNTNQLTGLQADSLASFIEHWLQDINLEQTFIDKIAHKHASLNIKPEHYPLIGKTLIKVIDSVLQLTSAEKEQLGNAYDELSNKFISTEEELYSISRNAGGWEGYKDFKIVSNESANANGDIHTLTLKPVDGDIISKIVPGQYITIKNSGNIIRHYSLTNNSNNKDSYEITVKHESGGKMSGYLHNADIGTILSIRPPFGPSIVDQISEEEYVSISGGVGLTYGLSNAEYIASYNPAKSVKLIYSTQSKNTEIFRDRIESLVKEKHNLHPTVFYSRDEIGNDANGIVQEYQGRINKKGLDRILEDNYGNKLFDVCGSGSFSHAILEILRSEEVSTDHIHQESFGLPFQQCDEHTSEAVASGVCPVHWNE